MDDPVAQHHRPSIQRLNHHPPDPTTRTPTGKAGQTSGPVMLTTNKTSRSTAQPATTGSIGGIRLSPPLGEWWLVHSNRGTTDGRWWLQPR